MSVEDDEHTLPSVDDRVQFAFKDCEFCMSEHYALYLETEVAQMLCDAEEEGGDTPSGLPFCGCPTCVVREVMITAIALAIEGIEKKEIKVHEVPA